MSVVPTREYYEEEVGWLPFDQIFVFGSNLAGRHGLGAALIARQKFGAVYGNPVGLQGQSYAIPTKDENLVPLTLTQVYYGIDVFVNFTYARPDLKWLVTAVACGYAGFHPAEVASRFAHAINCSFPISWKEYLEDAFPD